LEASNVPQMITLTFNGAMNTDNIDLYEEIFSGLRLNPNGCQAKGNSLNYFKKSFLLIDYNCLIYF
jgi:hypothetical protein